MRPRYWAVRPPGRKDAIRIEKAETAREAIGLAFGRPVFGDWEIKDLGTRVSVLHSDKKRIALLTSEEGWVAYGRKGLPT